MYERGDGANSTRHCAKLRCSIIRMVCYIYVLMRPRHAERSVAELPASYFMARQ